MDDDTLLEQFTGLHEAIGSQIQMTKDMKESVDGVKTELKDLCDKHDKDIRGLDDRVTTLETDITVTKTVEKEKANWIKEHPIQAGVGAGGITTIVMAGIAVITKILEVW